MRLELLLKEGHSIVNNVSVSILVCLVSAATLLRPAFAFEALLNKQNLYANQILDDPSVAKAARGILVSDYDDFVAAMSVSGPAVIVDNRYVFGQGCLPHQCQDINALVVVDIRERKVWLAMTDNGVGSAWPGPVKGWPAAIRAILRTHYQK